MTISPTLSPHILHVSPGTPHELGKNRTAGPTEATTKFTVATPETKTKQLKSLAQHCYSLNKQAGFPNGPRGQGLKSFLRAVPTVHIVDSNTHEPKPITLSLIDQASDFLDILRLVASAKGRM